MLPGRFLELSVATPRIVEEMGLFEELGFTELTTNEIVPYNYGVMGDGEFNIGFHDTEFESPTLSFVLPELATYADALHGMGIEFESAYFGDEHFHQLSFLDPGEQRVRLLEARTFSPSPAAETKSWLGSFDGIMLPEAASREAFWRELQGADEDHALVQVRVSENAERLAAVFKTSLNDLIVHSAQQGWQRFTISEDNHGVFHTPHHFDCIVYDT